MLWLVLFCFCTCIIPVSSITSQYRDTVPDALGDGLTGDPPVGRLKRVAALLEALINGARFISRTRFHFGSERLFLKTGGRVQAEKDFHSLGINVVRNNKAIESGFAGRSYVMFVKEGTYPQLRIQRYGKGRDGKYGLHIDVLEYTD